MPDARQQSLARLLTNNWCQYQCWDFERQQPWAAVVAWTAQSTRHIPRCSWEGCMHACFITTSSQSGTGIARHACQAAEDSLSRRRPTAVQCPSNCLSTHRVMPCHASTDGREQTPFAHSGLVCTLQTDNASLHASCPLYPRWEG